MSARLIVGLGCDIYDHSDQFGWLRGAESDASKVFSLLTDPEIGEYQCAGSTLLLSPTLDQVQEALRSSLFDHRPIDTFTLFFAGHGVLKSGSFYLCLRGSRFDALSATALSLSEVLRMIGEAAPVQANVIIDACESGGLIEDLNSILKHDVLGRGGTPSITLLAAAASDQAAIETRSGGVATQALVSCISGSLFVQDIRPALDLVEIGRVVSSQVSKRGGQTPLVWGLNLFGDGQFCRNPNFGSHISTSLRSLGSGLSEAATSAVRKALPDLYRLYDDAADGLDAKRLNERIKAVLTAFDSSEDPTEFVSRLQLVFRERTSRSADPFEAIEATAACLMSLTKYCPSSETARAHISRESLALSREVNEIVTSTLGALAADRFVLLSKRAALADLYYLPLRLAKLLGWAGAAYLIEREEGADTSLSARNLKSLSDLVCEHYSTAFRAMTDSQAPYLMVALSAYRASELHEAAEPLLSLLFSSALDCKGNVARNDLSPEKALEYVLARAKQNYEEQVELIAQPTELLLVMLCYANVFGLSEAFDVEMKTLDHVKLNAFAPADWASFSDEVIATGSNLTLEIGESVFSVAEVDNQILRFGFGTPRWSALKYACIFSSFVVPDRTPWFLLQSQTELPHIRFP